MIKGPRHEKREFTLHNFCNHHPLASGVVAQAPLPTSESTACCLRCPCKRPCKPTVVMSFNPLRSLARSLAHTAPMRFMVRGTDKKLSELGALRKRLVLLVLGLASRMCGDALHRTCIVDLLQQWARTHACALCRPVVRRLDHRDADRDPCPPAPQRGGAPSSVAAHQACHRPGREACHNPGC